MCPQTNDYLAVLDSDLFTEILVSYSQKHQPVWGQQWFDVQQT